MNKKIISLFIAAAVILQTSAFAAGNRGVGQEYDHVELAYDPVVNYATGGGAKSFLDIKDNDVKQSAELLAALGFLKTSEDGLFKPDDAMTRYDFTEIVINSISVDSNLLHKPEMDGFYDIDREVFENKVLSVASYFGIITGYGDNSFRPDDPIAYDDALTILMRASGYGQYAEEKGAYPAGYVAAANLCRVGISPKNVSSITKGEAAQLIAKWLESPILNPVTFSDDISYSRSENDTVLSVYHDIYSDIGVVETNSYASITGDSASKGQIIINGERYTTGENDFDSFLAYSVKYYYKDNKTFTDEVVYMHPESSVKVLNILADDLISVDGSTVRYYSDDKEKIAKINEVADVLVNGASVVVKNYEDVINIEEGAIVLISNDGDSSYDTVFVNEYSNLVANAMSGTDGVVSITPQFNVRTVKIDTQETKFELFDASGTKIEYERELEGLFNADGSPMTQFDFSKVPSNSVISFYADKYTEHKGYLIPDEDAGYVKAIVSTNVIEGALNGIDDENGYVIGETLCEVSKSNFLSETESFVKLGKQGKFYLDFSGELVSFSEEKAEYEFEYGYLIEAMPQDGVKGNLNFKIMDTFGNITVYKDIDSIRINNKNLDSDKAYEALQKSAKFANPDFEISQLIKFKLNENDKLVAVETLLQGLGQSSNADETHIRLDKEKSSYALGDDDAAWCLYEEGYRYLPDTEDKYLFAEFYAPLVVMTVPNQETFDEDEYSIGIELETYSGQVMELYNVSFAKVPDVAVRYIEPGGSGDKKVLTNRDRAMPVMIKDFKRTVNDNGDIVTSIVVATGEAEKTYTSDIEGIEKGFKMGDVVYLWTNNNKDNISKIEHVYYRPGRPIGADTVVNMNNTSEWMDSANNTYNLLGAYGEVFHINDRTFIIQSGTVVNETTGAREIQVAGAFRQYEYMFGGAILYDDTLSKDEPVIRPAKIADLKSVYKDGAENATRVFFMPIGGTARIYIFYNTAK